jgi:hypothetical protein
MEADMLHSIPNPPGFHDLPKKSGGDKASQTALHGKASVKCLPTWTYYHFLLNRF